MEKAFILFGATGDLAREKIYPILKNIKDISVIGYGRKTQFEPEYLGYPYLSGDFIDATRIKNYIKSLEAKQIYFYLSLPPSLYEEVIKFINHNFKEYKKRVALEKPFGENLKQSKKLALLIKKYGLKDYYLVDHYLAKRSIREAAGSKFSIKNVKSINLSMFETIGIGTRGNFYDGVGVINDVGQNHQLNTLDLFFKNNGINDFLSAAKYKKDSLVVGQYEGYRKEEGVRKSSKTPTYFSALFKYRNIDIILKSGKALKTKDITFEITTTSGVVKSIKVDNKSDKNASAHLNLIKDFINGIDEYSLDIQSAVNSWKIIDQMKDDIKSTKLVIYSPGSSPDIIDRLANES